MEAVKTELNISSEDSLSIQLRISGSSLNLDLPNSLVEANRTQDQPIELKNEAKIMSAESTSPVMDVLIQQPPAMRPKPMPHSKSDAQRRRVDTFISASDPEANTSCLGTVYVGKPPPESTKEKDCLLLDYQDQLFILERLNRKSSRKAKKSSINIHTARPKPG